MIDHAKFTIQAVKDGWMTIGKKSWTLRHCKVQAIDTEKPIRIIQRTQEEMTMIEGIQIGLSVGALAIAMVFIMMIDFPS
jgi:hypothetical protein